MAHRADAITRQLRGAGDDRPAATAAAPPPRRSPRTPRPALEPHRRFNFNQPLSGNVMSRFGGITTMMRLPLWPRENPQLGPDDFDTARRCAAGLDACFVGVPIDIGASNRAGTRHGPRAIRTESAILRPFNMATGASPFESLHVADVGDVGINTYSLPKSIETITQAFRGLIRDGCVPITMGGDHTITYPILRAIAERHGPVAVLHIDAHADTQDTMGGERIAHGTPFRRAVEDGLLDCSRVVQIGLRGGGYTTEEWQWGRRRGFKVIPAHKVWHLNLEPIMRNVHRLFGTAPVYISVDIDGINPSEAPGTGTPEIGGLTQWQVQQLIRGCRGLDVVGGDLTEVSPPYDPSGNTALVAANLCFEILCVLPGVRYHDTCDDDWDALGGGTVPGLGVSGFTNTPQQPKPAL